MHILITHGNLSKTLALHVRAIHLVLLGVLMLVLTFALTGVLYHLLMTQGVRDGWPIVDSVARLLIREDSAQRERFLRENLDAMAQKVGEMQAKIVKLEALSERVSGMAGLKPEDLRVSPSPGADGAASAPVAARAGRGGPFVPAGSPSIQHLDEWIASLDSQADERADVFTLIESRLLEKRLSASLVPSAAPVSGPVGSGFGFRIDPFTGRGALHTGLDFPAEIGTPITAAAGGVVVTVETHPAYGNMVEIDHGNSLVTRYAHTSKILVKQGDIVRRGQVIALVGTTGRSTGPHLHFEVLVGGVPQNPEKFLAQGRAPRPAGRTVARAPAAVAEPSASDAQ